MIEFMKWLLEDWTNFFVTILLIASVGWALPTSFTVKVKHIYEDDE